MQHIHRAQTVPAPAIQGSAPGTKAGKTKGGFQELLAEAMQTVEQPTQTEIKQEAEGVETQPREEAAEAPKRETETAEGAAAAAIAGQAAAITAPVIPLAQPEGEAVDVPAAQDPTLPIQAAIPPTVQIPVEEQPPLETPALPTLSGTPVQAQEATARTNTPNPAAAAPEAPVQAPPSQTNQTNQTSQTHPARPAGPDAGGDIVSIEATANPEQPTAAQPQSPVPATEQPVPDPSGQDKLGALLNQAQQELNAIGKAPAEAAQPAAIEAQAQTTQAAQATVEEPTRQAETAPQPAKTPEVKQAPDTPQPSMPRVVQQAKPDPTVMEQRPLREMHREDQKAAETTESKTAPTAAPEPQPEPAPTEAPRPVQTAQPQRPAEPADQMDQIRIQMDRNLEQNKMEFRMQLQPEELGKVDVKMVLEGGRLAVEILAASPKSAELLSRQAAGLVQSLRLQNLEVESVTVVTESQSADSHMDGAFNMMNGQPQQQDDQTAAAQNGHSRTGRGTAQSGEVAAEDRPETKPIERYRSPYTRMDYAI